MELEEEARRAEAELDRVTALLRRVSLIGQVKGQEELRAKAEARKKRRVADAAAAALADALKWHRACEIQVGLRSKHS